MASVAGPRNKKVLDFEIVLTPFIDLFSVCISFSLLTAVWIHLGSMDVKQAVGGQAAGESKNPPALWTKIDESGDLTLELRDAPKVAPKFAKSVIPGVAGKVNFEALASYVDSVKTLQPDLNTALIMPQAKTVYEDIITLMDKFKGSGLKDLGVSPL